MRIALRTSVRLSRPPLHRSRRFISRHSVLLIALVLMAALLAAAIGGRPIAGAVAPSFAAKQDFATGYAPLLPPPPAVNRFVNPDGVCGGNSPCYTTIQAAINASSAGDTINVAAATYVEEITIDKALTLLGPNAGINPNTGARVAEAKIVPDFSDPLNGGFAGPQLVTLAADGVTFNGFTLDGDLPCSNQSRWQPNRQPVTEQTSDRRQPFPVFHLLRSQVLFALSRPCLLSSNTNECT
jgi:hypothetical protein